MRALLCPPVLLVSACGRAAEPPPAPPPLPPHEVNASAADALAVVLAREPRVLGVGELHQQEGRRTPRTTLQVFTDELLPLLAPRTTDLVLETWVLDGTCGEVEEVVATEVPAETRRPPETEDDLVRAARRARELGVTPHHLTFTCDDYAAVLGDEGSVDLGRLMRRVTDGLRALALEGLATDDARVVLYGGGIHNDRQARPGFEEYVYGADVAAQGGAAYVELDLYHPDLVRSAATLPEEPWQRLLGRVTGPDRVVLHERAPGSFVLLLPEEPPVPEEGER